MKRIRNRVLLEWNFEPNKQINLSEVAKAGLLQFGNGPNNHPSRTCQLKGPKASLAPCTMYVVRCAAGGTCVALVC